MMRFISAVCVIVTLLCCCAGGANAQLPRTAEGLKQPRVLVLLDGSSSMLQPWSDGSAESRFKTAGRFVTSLMDSIYAVNAAVEFGLRVYGHQYPSQESNCYDTKQEIMFSRDNLTQMGLRLASITPRGVSPIAYSLQQAAELDLEAEQKNAYSIILITDGGESCNGDICKVAELMLKKKIFFRPYIISLADNKTLSTQYTCLGTYLQASNDAELRTAVKTIVDEYRPLLTMPTMTVKSQPAASAPPKPKPAPAAITIPIPKWIPEKTTSGVPVRINVKTVPVAFSAPVFQKEHTTVVLPALSPLPPDPAPVVVKKDTARPHTAPVVTIVDTVARAPVPKPATTTVHIVKADPPKATPPSAKPPTARPDKPESQTYIKEVEEAAETTMAIYFTDGKGKYYKTEPELELTNAMTGATVKKFYRNVNRASGEPDAMPLAAGTYNLLLPGKAKVLYRNIVIEEHKKNKITVKVNQGSLKFSYAGAPARPVLEFEALVKKNFQPGPAIHQACTAELPYEPGNYHIEIATQPVTVRNVDIEFGELLDIAIPEPGFLQVINQRPMGEAGLFCVRGDRYMQFYTMPLTGNTTSQKLQLQPGSYEIHWHKAPGAKESVQRFIVKSNAITQIELEQ